MGNQKPTEKSISDPEILQNASDELKSILKQLTMNQIRWIIARPEYKTDGEAAEAVGIKADTVYHWDPIVKRALDLMVADGVMTALEIRRRNLAKAMAVKAAGLDSPDEGVRQKAATEIIEWELGKAKQVSELTGEGGGPIEQRVVIYVPDNGRS